MLVAYFDPKDASTSLMISTLQGEVLKKIPGIAYWLAENHRSGISDRESPITWSQDGSRILFRGIGSEGNECPTIKHNLLGVEETYLNPGCWQVLDVPQNKIIWRQADLVAQDKRTPETWFLDYEFPSISPSGRYIAFYSYIPSEIKFYVIVVDSGRIYFDALLRGVFSHWMSIK